MSTPTRHSRPGLRAVRLALAALAVTGVALADDADPAGRVARLGYVQGQVSVDPAGLDDWAAADTNRPLTTGDKLWSDANSRAEVSIGSAVVRLGSSTGFSFLNLDDHTAQMQLTAGTLSVHVRSMSDTLEVDTPNVAVSLLGPGDYRVEVNDAGDTTAIKVSGGTAEVSGGGQDFAVHPQQSVTFSGTTQVTEEVASLGAPDAFDSWAYDRDRQAQPAQTSSYVSPEVVGSEDLDQNGTWQATPEDGYVWAPNTVAVGWAPYRFGHWIWISPWGWTWIDDAAWGFAPFHYGRWATFGGRWCWVPGPRRAHPVYAPALVAWVGGARPGVSAGFAGGGVAWFPLGPREVFVPAYPVSQTYIRNVNISNTTVTNTYVTNVYNHNVTNVHYVNRNAPGGMTAVSQNAFTSAQSVGRNAVHLSASEIAAAPVSAAAPPITPGRQSVLGAGVSGPGVRRPPPALQNRLVMAKTAPPPAPVPFALQEQAIRANGGRPLARSEVKSMQVLAPAARVRMTPAAAGAEPHTGMSRAAGANPPVPPAPAPAVKLRPEFRQPPPAPAPTISVPPGERAAPPPQDLPQRERAPQPHADRAPVVEGAPANDRPRSSAPAQPAEMQGGPGGQDFNRRVDRPAAPVRPAPALARPPASSPPPAPPPAPSPPPVQRAPASEPKPAKPAPHVEKPARAPVDRVNN